MVKNVEEEIVDDALKIANIKRKKKQALYAVKKNAQRSIQNLQKL